MSDIPVEWDVSVESLDPHPLNEVEDVDEVLGRDIPALHEDDVHEQIEVVGRRHAVVEHDPETIRKKIAVIIWVAKKMEKNNPP